MASAISFGGYTFPAATRLLSRDQPSTVDEQKIPFVDGANAPPGPRGSKVITIEGTVGGVGGIDSLGQYITSSAQLEAELNLMSSYLESGYQPLALSDITPARTILAQKRKSTFTPVPGSSRTAYDFTIELLAPDPRWLATAASTLTGAGTATSAGSGPTYPVITLTGYGSAPAVTIAPAGGSGSITLALAATGISGAITIDCDPRNRKNGILVAGVARLDLINMATSINSNGDSAFFPYLGPGNNAVSYSGAGTAAMNWRDAYLF
jgi:phage-related protein